MQGWIVRVQIFDLAGSAILSDRLAVAPKCTRAVHKNTGKTMFTTYRSRSLALACAFALSAAFHPALAAGSAGLPKGVSAGPCVEGICQYTLENGLRVLLFPDA